MVMLCVPGTAGAAGALELCKGENHCARLTAPLDHSGTVPGQVTLLLRHDFKPKPNQAVTLVLPGAPGARAASEYEWEELMPRRAVVTFDPRGTGTRALRCRDLEAARPTDAGQAAAACATLLGERRQFFRASDTVEDMELLRAELGVEQVTIVGAGYGSYVAQQYAQRYPARVERLILSSVVDAAGPDPLFRDSAAAARRVLEDLCESACDPFTRDPAGDTRTLVQRLAAAPLRGSVVGPNGRRRGASLTREELLFTLLAGDDNPLVRSDYPAAVVSALEGDPAPVLRLQHRATSPAYNLPARYVSPAAAAAATCEEVRFPWAWQASPEQRAEAASRTEAEMPAWMADPFDPGTLVRSEPMRLCGSWPTASAAPPPEPGPMPDVPVLILAEPGRLATPVEAAMRTAARFPHSHLLVTSNGFFLGECSERAVVRFMRGERVQDRCPPAGPVVAPAQPAPRSLGELAPVRGVPGRRGKLVRAFALTLGDLIDDYFSTAFFSGSAIYDDEKIRGGGLRGGSFFLTEDRLRLRRYQFVPGVRLSAAWNPAENGSPVYIDGPGALNGRIRLGDTEDDLSLRVRGRIAGRRVATRVQIPVRALEVAESEASAGASALPWSP